MDECWGPEVLAPSTVKPALAAGPAGKRHFMDNRELALAVREEQRLFVINESLARRWTAAAATDGVSPIVRPPPGVN